ncbi:MAG: hypothetical protein DCF22_25085 [Leptolyngbya sp.]|nr:MAG: hypothetical protein DCF22_25085 [Leptolyngbya sp.]
MAMDLEGVGGDFGLNVFSWGHMLCLARLYGWQPAGTVIDEADLQDFPNGKWNGGYQSNDGQKVTTEDARNMADALEKALADIPDHDALEYKKELGGGILIAPNGPDVSALKWFSGNESKEYVRKFIAYCRAGEFKIY